MKSKSIFVLVWCGLLAGSTAISCRKAELADARQKTTTGLSKTPLKEPAAEAVMAARSFFQDYLGKQNFETLPTGTKGESRPWPYPDWTKAEVKEEIGGQVVEVPLNYTGAIRFSVSGQDKKYNAAKQSTLKMRKGKEGSFKVTVVLTLPDGGFKTQPGKPFSGLVVEKNWDGSIIKSVLHKNGKETVLRPSNRDQNLAGKNILECTAIDYYECDDIDEFGVGTNCRYLYTEYIGCTDDDDGGGGTGGGGTGGEIGGGGAGDDPNLKDCSALDNLVSASRVVSETIGFDVADINSITKSKNPKWMILKNFPWALFSMELGLVELIDAQENVWAWKSLDHSHIYMVGSPLPGIGVSFSNGVGTPSFTAGTRYVYYASMKLQYTVRYSLLGKESWCPGLSMDYPAESEFWPAKP